MSYIKRKRDRRDYEMRQALEAHLLWRPRLMLGLNKDAIEEELAISNDRIWTGAEPMTFTPIWGGR